jgi:acetolactate synthase small subunit
VVRDHGTFGGTPVKGTVVLNTHRLALTVTDQSAALERIVSACRSRQCTIVSLQFAAADRHRPGRVELTLAGSSRMIDLAVARLARLVDVIEVEREGERRSVPVGRLALAL